MKETRITLIAMAAFFGVVAAVLFATRQVDPDSIPPVAILENSGATQPLAEAAPGLVTRTEVDPKVGNPEAEPHPAPPQTASPPKQQPNPVSQTNGIVEAAATPSTPGGGKRPLRDPFARVALFFVGADPDAEAYWYEAINDNGLSAHERSDLIEDLNEDGLSDPKHPTADDLPLIFNRMLIIEEIASEAMDEVNADAFQEAYKDLVNLADLVMGGGQPVR